MQPEMIDDEDQIRAGVLQKLMQLMDDRIGGSLKAPGLPESADHLPEIEGAGDDGGDGKTVIEIEVKGQQPDQEEKPEVPGMPADDLSDVSDDDLRELLRSKRGAGRGA